MFFSTVATALFALPFLTQSVFATDCARTYTVKEGDWCDTISAANNVSTYQLAVVNNGKIDKTCSNLQIGDQICLGATGSDCKNTHVVKAGDSCEAVAQTYSVNATMFNVNNPQLTPECDNLYIGEVVCVANSPLVQALPEGVPMPAATVPAGATPAQTNNAVVSATTSAAPSATPSAEPEDDEDCDDEDDEDEEDLPWCDEL
ncbi:hypothetical protein QCA50_007277 [Cerrena zonata]|uniref:LysM domain-containing protein n=1 Tax=Cerrena zonata TaxID=2478898 RepID=A0AAW0GK56_9APHY